jgi:hypothetical protein
MGGGRKQVPESIVGLSRQIEVGAANRKTAAMACKAAQFMERTDYLYGLLFFYERRSSDVQMMV